MENMIKAITYISVCIIFIITFESHAIALSDSTVNAKLEKYTIFIGDSTNIIVTFCTKSTVHNLQYPVLNVVKDAVINDFNAPRQYEDGAFTCYEFRTIITPKIAGVTHIDPVRIIGDISVQSGGTAGFFGETKQEQVTFSSTSLALKVLPLPKIGKPADFSGLIGNFTLNFNVKPVELSLGEPLTSTILINGRGSFTQKQCPELQIPHFKSYPVQPKISTNLLQCTQVFISEKSGSIIIPAVKLSFFNSSSASYETLKSKEISVSIVEKQIKNAVQNATTSHKKEQLSLPLLNRKTVFLSFFSTVFIIITLIFTVKFRKRNLNNIAVCDEKKSENDQLILNIREAEQAFFCKDVDRFYLHIYRAAEILSADLESEKEQMMSDKSDVLSRERYIFKAATVEDLINSCNAVRYGRYSPQEFEMEKIFSSLKAISQ